MLLNIGQERELTLLDNLLLHKIKENHIYHEPKCFAFKALLCLMEVPLHNLLSPHAGFTYLRLLLWWISHQLTQFTATSFLSLTQMLALRKPMEEMAAGRRSKKERDSMSPAANACNHTHVSREAVNELQTDSIVWSTLHGCLAADDASMLGLLHRRRRATMMH